jgi:hypothetical protein
MVSFTEGRYAQVVRVAMNRAGVDSAPLPRLGGPSITRIGQSTPLRTWGKYRIQRLIEMVSWPQPPMRERAEACVAVMGVELE